MNVHRITPCLWFKKNDAAEAMEYYTSVFPHSHIVETKKYPDENLDEHFKGMSGKVLTGVFELDGQRFMCLDGGEPTPNLFDFNNAVSFSVECEDQAEIDHFWEKLSAQPDQEQCGWCTDKFGVRWQIVPKDMDKLMNSEAAMKVMMQQKKIIIQELENA